MVKLVEKPVTKLNDQAVRKMFDLIDTSKEKDSGYFRMMNVLRNLVKGDHWKDLKLAARQREQTKMVINLANSHVRTLMPTLFFKTPTVKVFPRHRGQESKAPTWKAVSNHTLDHIDFAEEVKKITFDAIVYPEGCFKWAVNRPPEQAKQSTEDNKDGPTIWLEKGAPVPVRLSPVQLIVDYNAPGRNLDQARFIAVRYRKSLAELKRDPKYKIPRELQLTDVSLGQHASSQRKRFDPFAVWEERGDEIRSSTIDHMVTIYECWVHQLVDDDGDLDLYQQMFVLMDGLDKPIKQPVPWTEVLGEGFNQYPVDRLIFNPIPDDLPGSELGVKHSIQVAINWLMSRILAVVEQEKLIYEFDGSKIKNEGKAFRQFKSGRPIEYVEVEEVNALNLVQPTFVQRDHYTMVNLLAQFDQQVGGVGLNRQGRTGARTATEASLVDQGTNIKTNEKVATMQKFLHSVVSKMLRLIRTLVRDSGNTNFIFRAAGDTGTINWLEFTAEELDWEPDVEIEVDSFRERDQGEEIQRLLNVWQVTTQAMSLGQPARLDILLRQIYEAFNIQDIDKILFSAQDQMVNQSMELVLLALGQPAPVNPQDNHQVHIDVIAAFRNTKMYAALPPEGRDAVEQHDAQHQEAIQQTTRGASGIGTGQNPFEGLNDSVNPDPANLARQASARERIPLGQPNGLGGGQRI